MRPYSTVEVMALLVLQVIVTSESEVEVTLMEEREEGDLVVNDSSLDSPMLPEVS